MVPIALTCPVWWVARWTARMLASLAVVVAFSLGAASLPVGATAQAGAAQAGAAQPGAARAGIVQAASAFTAPRPSGIPVGHLAGSGPALPGAVHRPLNHWSDRAEARSGGGVASGPAGVVRVAGPVRVGLGRGVAVREGIGARATGASLAGAAGWALAAIVPAGPPASVQRQAPVVRLERQHLLVATAPATVGSRAPPAC